MHRIVSNLALLFGLVCIFLFHADHYIYLPLSLIVFFIVSADLFSLYKEQKVGYAVGIFWLCYALPFIHAIPYLWFDFNGEHPNFFWGLASNPYMFDESVINLMLMIGSVGAAGFQFGVAVSARGRLSPIGKQVHSSYHLSDLVYLLFTLFAVLFAAINTPDNTVIRSAYTEVEALSVNLNYSSVGTLAYVMIVFLTADAILEQNNRQRIFKIMMIAGSLMIVVGWFQIARGDRESFPTLLAVLLLYFTGKNFPFRLVLINRRFLTWVLGVAVLSYFVNILRSQIAGIDSVDEFFSLFGQIYSSGQVSLDSAFHGTWSAVLLTPLSVAGDYLDEALKFKYGSTYLNMALSLPPGFIADLLEYKRPFDAYNGPAWEMRYGLGGTHITVIPFMNFGMVGVLFICGILGMLAYRIDKVCIENFYSTYGLTLLGVIVSIMPHFIWYGEKHLINSLIYWFLMWIVYRVVSKSRVIKYKQ